jgi:MFS family permease
MTTTFLFVVLSDIAPEAQRANAFLRVGAFNILAQLVMPPLAAWLMKYNPWYVPRPEKFMCSTC